MSFSQEPVVSVSSASIFQEDHTVLSEIDFTIDKGEFDSEDVKQFEQLLARLTSLLTEETPTLLHGDLWSGNFVAGANEKAYLIDPAVYYGHREMDLAMTRLFGGFDARFYDAYEEAAPLPVGLETRIDLYQLWPLVSEGRYHA